MQRPTRKALGVLGGLALSVAVAAQAQDEGVKRVEELVKRAGSTVQAIGEAKLQFLKTIDVYNSIFAEDAKDRKKLYKKLQSEMAATQEKRAEVGRRSDQMKLEAGIVFKSWADSTAAIESPDLRKRSEERLEKTKDRLAEIQSAGQSAVDVYEPVMKALQDQVTYLGHDLNAEAVASLKPDAEKVNAQAKELTERLDEAMAVANQNINALRPQ